MKICKKCGEEKDELDFDTHINDKTGREYLRNTCKKCRYTKHKEQTLDWQLEANFGITRAQWEMFLELQDNKCKICGKEFDGKIKICTDHDHKTNIVRGLLCQNCNISLRSIDDNFTWLEKAANYVRTANALKELNEHLQRKQNEDHRIGL